MNTAAKKTLRTHHSRWRMSGKERSPRRGRGWTTWTGLKGKAGRDERSKSVVERLRETAEKTSTTEVGTRLKGQERASAATFLEPGMWTISLVNSEM